MKTQPHILLVDDHQLMRQGMRALLEGAPGSPRVSEAENGRRAVELARELRPDIVVMDVTMPDLNGIEATRQILESHPDIPIIALSMHSDRRYVFEMFRAGAKGYLLKDCAFDELNRAIRTVLGGHPYVSPSIAGALVSELKKPHSTPEDATRAASPDLTSREKEVLQLMAEGRSTKEIAAVLHISVKTVETHRRQLMSKLQVHSVAELTRYAIREGLTPL